MGRTPFDDWWYEYSVANGWQMELSRAVSASACVPLAFEPLRLRPYYDDIDVHALAACA
jgi:hypothetical protein